MEKQVNAGSPPAQCGAQDDEYLDSPCDFTDAMKSAEVFIKDLREKSQVNPDLLTRPMTL